jgi:hypothetical protein
MSKKTKASKTTNEETADPSLQAAKYLEECLCGCGQDVQGQTMAFVAGHDVDLMLRTIAKEYGIEPGQWRVLVEQVFPSAKSVFVTRNSCLIVPILDTRKVVGPAGTVLRFAMTFHSCTLAMTSDEPSAAVSLEVALMVSFGSSAQPAKLITNAAAHVTRTKTFIFPLDLSESTLIGSPLT